MDTTTSTLPVAIKRGERRLLQAAARQLGKKESTYLREAALAVARAQLRAAAVPLPERADG